MKSPKVLALGATGALVLSLGLAACGGDDDGDKKGGGGGGGGSAKFDAGATTVVNPSDKKGGVLKFASTDDFDSTDPGNLYYAWTLNFSRLYSRPLMTYKSKPGKEGTELVPDLAEAPGTSADGDKTWTFKIKKGLKYEDGTEIKAKDVKYAVARTFDRGVLGKGPSWFSQLLDAKDYKGPYKDKNLDNFKAVQTPDDNTIVFKTNQPVPEFNYVAALPQTTPVPQAKDTGARYLLHPISSGPYKWEKYEPKKGGALVPNTNWDPATDQTRKQLPARIEFTPGVAADELDQRLMNGTVHIDTAGTGVSATARQKILTNPSLKNNADNPFSGFSWFVPINTALIKNAECRKAIVYAADRDAMWRAYGGEAGGEMSTGVIPPNIAAHKDITDVFPPAKPGYKGDPVKAKESLTKCGQPSGFSTNIAFRSDRPKEKLVAEALEQSLAKVGIKTQLKGYPAGTYTSEQFGSPAFNKKENIGLGTYGWAADWPTGYGYLQPLTDSRAIVPTGNVNMAELRDPKIDSLWTQAAQAKDTASRDALASQVDHDALAAAAYVPNIYAKSLIYRPPTVTNVFLQQYYGMYDYTVLGVTG